MKLNEKFNLWCLRKDMYPNKWQVSIDMKDVVVPNKYGKVVSALVTMDGHDDIERLKISSLLTPGGILIKIEQLTMSDEPDLMQAIQLGKAEDFISGEEQKLLCDIIYNKVLAELSIRYPLSPALKAEQ